MMGMRGCPRGMAVAAVALIYIWNLLDGMKAPDYQTCISEFKSQLLKDSKVGVRV